MNKKHPFGLIRRPVVTEKSTQLLGTRNIAAFDVDPKATKPMIKRAVESLFQVRVKRVRTMNRLGKVVRSKFGKHSRRSSFKRAYVELYPGEKISLLDQGAQI